MKLKLKRITRIIAPLLLCCMIVIVIALPAFAADMSIASGTYFLADEMEAPDVSFLVNVNFSSGGDDYKGIIFRTGNPDATFKYPALYYIRQDNGDEFRVAYWINQTTYWQFYDARVIRFPDNFSVDNATFYAWFSINATKVEHGGSSGTFPDYSESEDIQGALDRLEGIDDEYNKLPQPVFWDDWLGAAVFQTQAYESFLTVLDVLYQDSFITNIITTAGPMILVSFLIFAGKD